MGKKQIFKSNLGQKTKFKSAQRQKAYLNNKKQIWDKKQIVKSILWQK